MGLICGCSPLVSGELHELFSDVFRRRLGRVLGCIWRGVWTAKWRRKSNFRFFLHIPFFKHLFIDFLIVFGRLRTLIIALPPAPERDFCKIGTFKKS